MARENVRKREDPWSAQTRADADFEFAAEQTVVHMGCLQQYREELKELLRKLAERTACISAAA